MDVRQPSRTGQDVAGSDESSLTLVHRARGGHADALERLFKRYRAPLVRWASGRLPAAARHALDTEDLVQDTLLNSLRRLRYFEPRGHGAFEAYLRQSLKNRIRDEARRLARTPSRSSVVESLADPSRSPLEEAIGAEELERYEAALGRLRVEDQAAILARIELGLDHAEVAKALGRSSPDAARMAVSRAVTRLAREMRS